MLSEPQVRLEGGVFANKIIGGDKKFRGSTDEAGASGQSFRMEGIDQLASSKLIPETIAFFSSKIELHQTGRY